MTFFNITAGSFILLPPPEPEMSLLFISLLNLRPND